MRWCIRSVFGIEVYQEAGRLLTFPCYITLICVLCISYVCATQNGISIILITCSLWSVVCFLCWQFLLSLTTLSLRAVDSSKVVGGLPREEMSEVFAQTWGQTFFEESRSRQTQQSFFHACSALPRSSYHNWATTTFHNHRKVTILYLLFKETSLFDWRLVRASVRYFSRTLVAGRKLVGWGGAYLIIVFFLHNCNFTLESA